MSYQHFTVGDIQSQVTLLAGHANLSDKVLVWTNRVIQDIVLRAFWPREMGVVRGYRSNVTYDTAECSGWGFSVGWDTTRHQEFVAPMAAANIDGGTGVGNEKYYRPLVQHGFLDILARGAGKSQHSGVNESVVYGMHWGSVDEGAASLGGTPYQYVLGYPLAGSTSAYQKMRVDYLGSPSKFTASSDYNWIVDYHFPVVLAGVMRYARLFLGDPQGYLLEKSIFENGIKDMVSKECSSLASSPVLQGVVPEVVMRNQ